MASVAISPKEIVNALQKLNDEQSKELFFQLEVPLNILDQIEGNHRGNMRKIHYVQAWFDNEVKASWDKIVAGLELIGMKTLAATLATRQCLGGTLTSAAISVTTDLPSSLATAPGAVDPVTSGSFPNHPSIAGPVAHHPSSPSLASVIAHHPSSPSLAGVIAHHPSSPSLASVVACPTSPSLAGVVAHPSSPSLVGVVACPTSPFLAGVVAHLSSPSLVGVVACPTSPFLTGVVAHPSSPSLTGVVAHPSSSSDRVAQVRAEIDRLSDTFSDLMSDTRDEMCARENIDPAFLKRFRDRLLDLPVAKKSPHTKFFRDHIKEILIADMKEIFATLRLYCSYNNYELLREVVRKFCEAVLQQRMLEYCESLEKFEKATFIDVYLKAIEASDVLTLEFKKMTLKINKPTSECTLHEVRKFKETIAERASLQSYSVYIGDISESSVQLVLGFPPSCLGWILGVLTPSFLATHILSDVALDEKHLSILDWPREELDKTLCVASRAGDIIAVVSLLNSGADIQTEDGELATPLDCASFSGFFQVIHFLLSRGAKLNHQNEVGWTTLMRAAISANCGVIDELISQGAEVDIQNNSGHSALMLAAWYGRTDVVRKLVKAGANLDLQNKKGDTAVIRATIGFEPDTLRELVTSGCDLNLQNQEGLTALMIAARNRRTDLTNILLGGEHIDPDIQENRTGWSALHFSAERGDSDTTEALLKAGANALLKDKNGLTALQIAQVKATERPKSNYWDDWVFRPACYPEVISLLKEHMGEELASYHEFSVGGCVSTTGQDRPPVHSPPILSTGPLPPTSLAENVSDTESGQQESRQDTPPAQEDSSGVHEETTATQQGTAYNHTTTYQRKERTWEALRNLVSKSGQIALQIFNDLDRRLKSSDKKDQSGVPSQMSNKTKSDHS